MMWWRAFWSLDKSEHWEAFKEVFFVAVISTTPIWLGAIVSAAIDNDLRAVFSKLFDFLTQGELFLYCMSIVATIFWLASKSWPRPRGDSAPGWLLNPPRDWFFLLALIPFALSVVFFGIDLVKVRIDPGALIEISASAYGLSLLLYYVLLALNKVVPPDIETTNKEGAIRISDELGQRKGQ